MNKCPASVIRPVVRRAAGLLLFLTAMPLPAAQLVLHWGLNDGVANAASPLAEDDGQDPLTPAVDPDNNRDGTFTALGAYTGTSPQWRTTGGVHGSGYLHFDGSPDTTTAGYTMRFSEGNSGTGANVALPSGPPYTISLWYRVHPNGATGEMGGVLGMLTDSAASNRYMEVDAWYSYNLGVDVINTITATHRQTNFMSAASSPNTAWFDGEWHHMVAVFSSLTLRTLYVDGALVATNTTANSSGTAVNPNRFSIGALDRTASADYFSGDLDEVALYRGELTPAEINALYMGTNPDSDNDGMTDTWETAHALNVGLNDAALDPDTDTLTNLQEFQAGTDPHLGDTDSDGLTDGAEVNTHHTSPLLADSDGDSFTDSYELLEGTDPSLSASFPPPLRLALHWGLNDGTGDTASDDGQNPLTPGPDTSKGRHGQYAGFNHAAGAPIWRSSGGVNNSGYLHFDGDESVPTGYVMRYLDPGSQLPAGGYSISLWFRVSDASGGGGCAGLVNFAGGGTPGGLYYQAGAYPGTGVQAQINHRNGNPAAGAQIVTTQSFNFGPWHHLVAVFATDSSRTVYVDSVPYGENVAVRGLINPDRFSIGALDRPTTADRFSGDIDEVHVYVGELLPADVHALFNAGQTDADGDGLPDTWEAGYGLNPALNDGAADADGDGQSNFEEFNADTNPASAADALTLNFTITGAQSMLSFTRKSTRGYLLQRSSSLTSWENILDFPAYSDGGLTETPATPAGARAFYRLRSYVP